LDCRSSRKNLDVVDVNFPLRCQVFSVNIKTPAMDWLVRKRSANLTYHHGDLRSALVTAGVELLAEKGLETLSLREVARRAGVSHSAPYRHFDDKEALLSAIADDGFRKLDSLMSCARDLPQRSDAERLRAALIFYLEFGRSHPHHIDLMFGAPARCKPAGLQKIARASFEGLVGLVKGAMEEADPANVRDPRMVALAIWGQVHGLLVLSRHGELGDMLEGPVHEDAALRAITVTLDAILPR